MTHPRVRSFLLALLLATLPLLSSCDSCYFANDGDCDELGVLGLCAAGTDTTDCQSSCSDTCETALDGACDDGGSNADFSSCELGTDCGDCGTR